MKTSKQQDYHKSRCSYCKGTGLDIFNKNQPCPNCSKEPSLSHIFGDVKNELNKIK